MNKSIIAVLAVTFILAACGGSAEPVVVEEEPAPTAELVAEPTAEPTAEPEEEPAAEPSAATFQIDTAASVVRFYIDEVLLGQDVTVVGESAGITEGSITVDYSQPQAAQVSPIVIDLTGLETDNGNRTRAMHNFILLTGTYPTATFEPTDISGLPESVTIGEPFTFQITGRMTIQEVTRELTFETTVTPVSETELSGIASTTIMYPDFGVNIPRLPDSVASVEEEVILEIEFIAVSE